MKVPDTLATSQLCVSLSGADVRCQRHWHGAHCGAWDRCSPVLLMGHPILNISEDAVRAGELCEAAPVPRSHLLLLHGDATGFSQLRVQTPCLEPITLRTGFGAAPGLLLQGSGGPW